MGGGHAPPLWPLRTGDLICCNTAILEVANQMRLCTRPLGAALRQAAPLYVSQSVYSCSIFTVLSNHRSF